MRQATSYSQHVEGSGRSCGYSHEHCHHLCLCPFWTTVAASEGHPHLHAILWLPSHPRLSSQNSHQHRHWQTQTSLNSHQLVSRLWYTQCYHGRACRCPNIFIFETGCAGSFYVNLTWVRVTQKKRTSIEKMSRKILPWVIFLISDWWERAQPSMDGAIPGMVVLGL